MACHGGGCCTSDILVKCGSIYVLFISPLFSKMADGEVFEVRNCKYSLPISNPNILYLLIVCQNVVNYVEAWLCEGH